MTPQRDRFLLTEPDREVALIADDHRAPAAIDISDFDHFYPNANVFNGRAPW